MPVKTITADIDGKVRKITADIPDDARPDEIEAAVRQHLASESDALGGYKKGDSESIIGHRLETAKPAKVLPYLVDTLVSPVTSIPGAVKEVGDFVKSGFRAPVIGPNGRLGPPDYAKDNPMSDAVGGIVGTLATAGATPKLNVAEPAPSALGSGSIINGMRNLYSLWKQAKKLSPSSLAERGFEAFLDHMEGKQGAVKTGEPTGGVVSPASAEVPQPVQSPVQQPQVSTPAKGTVTPIDGPGPITRATIKPAEPISSAIKKIDAERALYEEMKANGSLPTEVPPDIPASAYEAEGRSSKADTVAQWLYEKRYSPESVREKITASQWKELFKALGENEPGSSSGDPSTTIQQVQLKLKKLYDAEKPEVVKPRIRRRTK